MKVYVAGSYQHREAIKSLVDKMIEAVPGFECTSTWIQQGEEKDELETKGHQHFIDLDFADIDRADALLLINDHAVSKNSTGKWVELGIAMQLHKLIIVWGDFQNSLFLHDEFTIWERSPLFDDLIKTLRAVSVQRHHQLYSETI